MKAAATKSPAAPIVWANRIVAHGEAAPPALVANPGNWRRHGAAQQRRPLRRARRGRPGAVGDRQSHAAVTWSTAICASSSPSPQRPAADPGRLRRALRGGGAPHPRQPRPDRRHGRRRPREARRAAGLGIESEDDAVRALLERIARAGPHRAAGERRPHRPRRGPRAARGAGQPSPATSSCSASIACSAATRPTPTTSQRLMAGKRATPHGHRPALPRRLPGRRSTRRARPTAAPRARTSTGTPTSTTSTRSSSTSTSCARPSTTPSTDRRRHLPVVRHHAHRGHLAELARGRPARPPGADLEEDAAACSPTRTSCGTTSR